MRILKFVFCYMITFLRFLHLQLFNTFFGWFDLKITTRYQPSSSTIWIITELLKENTITWIIRNITLWVYFVERQLIWTRTVYHVQTILNTTFLFFFFHFCQPGQSIGIHHINLFLLERLFHLLFLDFIDVFGKTIR